MAFGDVILTEDLGAWADSHTLSEPVAAGNTILYFAGGQHSTDRATAVEDDLNGVYEKVIDYFDSENEQLNKVSMVVSTDGTTAPVLSIADVPPRSFVIVIEGALESAGNQFAQTLVRISGSSVSFSTDSFNIPANSVTVGFLANSANMNTFSLDSPWDLISGSSVVLRPGVRSDISGINGEVFSGAYGGQSEGYLSVSAASFTEAGGGTLTPGLPATTILDKDGSPLTNTQVAVTVTAGATTLYDDTPTTDGSGLLPELDFSAHGSEPEVDDEVTWTITAGGITQSVTRTLVDLGD